MQRFHGGLRCDPGERGTGIVVRLFLPSADLGQETPVRADAPQLLVAHDDAMLLETMRRILERRGWRVTAVGSAAAALSAYQTPKQTFDLVLADVLMPGMSGLEMARKILDLDVKASFLFLYAQPSFHRLADEELLKRFPLLRWPTEASAFVHAVQTALFPPSKPESGKSTR
jgi:CheY-like chemotaxis protein